MRCTVLLTDRYGGRRLVLPAPVPITVTEPARRDPPRGGAATRFLDDRACGPDDRERSTLQAEGG